ncbi:MAG: UDP-glucose/GDP-mannose dehydrogenase family protein, partial [Bacteroidia bacterium]|nr:UDP-glucose/GDP-mannose dehydrogenase family protein [Bacteroidia bacterium]
ENVNESQKEVLFDKVKKHFNGDLKGKKFALWGLSFKPKTDDMREAPSLVLIEQLLNDGASVIAYDPVAMHEAQRIVGETIDFATEQYEVLENADALVVVTEWPEFRSPDFELIASKLKQKALFDGRNIYEPEDMMSRGFHYECIGREIIN